MKPQMLEEFYIDSIYLPFVQNVIDMTQAQQVVDAEVAFALNGNWNATDWGSRTDFWKYFITHYGHYRIMYEYCEEVNDTLVCDHLDFNKGAYPVLMANHEKYDRLAKSLKSNYDVLSPYNIEEEHSTGNKTSKTTMHYDQHEDKNKESSMDNTTLYDASSTVYAMHDDTIDREHNQSTSFKNATFEPNSDETSHTKDSRIGNIGNHSFSELIEKELKLARYNLWEVISHDLLDNICLKFFMSC